MKKNNLTKIKCTSKNCTSLLNKCILNNIEINNVYKDDDKGIIFDLNDENLKKFKKLSLENYKIEIERIGGFRLFRKLLINRIGVIVGFIISMIFCIILSNRVVDIKILGVGAEKSCEILDKLSDYGCKKYSKFNFNFENMENYLNDNFDFSLVSIIRRGNVIVINVKEELSEKSNKNEPIYSDFDMVITEIKVFAGTTTYKVGDIVYRGDVLVEPYVYKGEERLNITPSAKIVGDVYYSEKYDFYLEEKIKSRTGESKIINIEYSLGKIKLGSDQSDNLFEYYEIYECESLISNYFLPIKIKKVIAYELEEKNQVNNFDDCKNEIINVLKNRVYSIIDSNISILEEDYLITNMDYGYLINYYIKGSITLNYN